MVKNEKKSNKTKESKESSKTKKKSEIEFCLKKEECGAELGKLKENYNVLKNKYNLPSFSQMNEDFDIEKIASMQTEFLVREIRKRISERLSNILRFAEMFLNPTNAPMFVFSLSKNLDAFDKGNLEYIYKKSIELEMAVIYLDVKYSEKDEAEFIKKTYKEWPDMMKKLLQFYESIKKNLNLDTEKSNKGYFG